MSNERKEETMKRLLKRSYISFAGLVILGLMIHAQPGSAQSSPPPISPSLLREGTLAIRLEFNLAIGTTDDEVEAESRLAEAGISPRNGWIADYPVTPDVIGELQNSISDAVDSGKLPLAKDDALQRFNDTIADFGLSMSPYAANSEPGQGPPDSQNYPNPSEINDYYYDNGPPIVTYYVPPPDFYYLYAWVPFPFWCSGFWFPGFYVLHDFHRTVIVGRRAFFVTNHFNDVRLRRAFRIDPRDRFSGRTFAGIGAPRRGNFLSTGVSRSDRRIFNAPPTMNVPRGVMTRPSFTRQPSPAGPRTPQGGARVMPAPRGGGVRVAPSPRSVVPSVPRGGAVQRAPAGRSQPFGGGGRRR